MITLERYISDLCSDNFIERNKAIKYLSSFHEKDIYHKIIDLLDTDNDILRNSCIEIICSWGHIIVPLLINKDNYKTENVKIYLCNILGNIKDERSVDFLLSLMNSSNNNVSFSAIEALGKVGSKKSTIPLLQYLDSCNDIWQKYPVILAIGQISDEKSVPFLIRLLDNEILQQPVLKALSDIGDERCLSYLIKFLTNESYDIHKIVLVAIRNLINSSTKYNEIESLNLLIKSKINQISNEDIELLTDNVINIFNQENIATKLNCIYLLGLVGSERSTNFLLENYSPDYLPELEVSISHICQSNPDNIIKLLIEKPLDCKELIIKILGDLNIKQSFEVISQNLTERDPLIRISAINSLGKLLVKGTLDDIFPLIKDNVIEVQDAVLECVCNFDSDDILHKVLDFKDTIFKGINYLAIRILASLKNKVNLETIFQFYDKTDLSNLELAKALNNYDSEKAIDKLVSFLFDSNPILKEEAIRSLENKGEKSLQYLILLSNDENEWVRYCVAKALSKQASTSEVIKVLKKLLYDNTPFVKITAIKTIGNLKIKSFLDDLFIFINDINSDISEAAILSIGEFNLDKLSESKYLSQLNYQIENSNWLVRKAIAISLRKLTTEKSFDILLKLLAQESNFIVDKEIITSLGFFKNHNFIINLLIDLTSHDSLREVCINTLSNMDKEIIFPYIENILKSKNTDLKRNMIIILAKINDYRSINLLINTSVEDHSPTIRKDSILILKNFMDNKRVLWSVIWSNNNDSDTLVKEVSKNILTKIDK